SHFLLFQPDSGRALEAESMGRLALLAYAGYSGTDGKLRRTQGGLRLSKRMLDAVIARLKPGAGMTLQIEPLRDPAWWQFWKQRVETKALSITPQKPMKAPADELSIMQELLKSATLKPRPARRPYERDRDDDDRWRDRDRSSGSSSSRDTFQGRGGESGGAGA